MDRTRRLWGRYLRCSNLSLLFWLLGLFSNPSAAQSTTPPPETEAPPANAPNIPPTPSSALLSSSSTIPPYPSATDLYSHPSSTDPSDEKSGLLNYYFVFLALFIALLCLAAYWLHRRRTRLKARSRHSGQDALARDLDGWVNTRRWLRGGWRGGDAGVRRGEDEGLDEFGEAPPPYEAGQRVGGDAGGAAGLTIPLRTLSRGSHRTTLKPPDYQEEEVRGVSGDRDGRPNTSDAQGNVSMEDLLRPAVQRSSP